MDDGPDIPERWTLTREDLTLIMAKSRANRLCFAVLLLFYRAYGRFPNAPTEIVALRTTSANVSVTMLTMRLSGTAVFAG